MVPRVLALLACLLLVGAGCLAGPAATDTPTESPTKTVETPATTATSPTSDPTADESGTRSASYGTNCPYRLHGDVASESDRDRIDRRVAYANLSEPRQEEFRRAVSAGSVELGNTLPEPWGGPVLVEYEGELYTVVASVC